MTQPSMPPITGPDPEPRDGDQTTRITVQIKRSELRMFLLLLPETVDYLEVSFPDE